MTAEAVEVSKTVGEVLKKPLIITDLDGTILNADSELSAATADFMQALSDLGYTIVVATGRFYAAAREVLGESKFAKYLICDNGASIYDAAGEVIYQNVISKQVCHAILANYNENCINAKIATKSMMYKYPDVKPGYKYIEVLKDFREIDNLREEITHISLGFDDQMKLMEVYRAIQHSVPDVGITIMQDSLSDNRWLDIQRSDANKYTAITLLSNILHVANEDIVAFGDGLNDIEMLRRCGHGVAVSNALPSVKVAANAVTDFDHNHNGVALYLANYLGLNQ